MSSSVSCCGSEPLSSPLSHKASSKTTAHRAKQPKTGSSSRRSREVSFSGRVGCNRGSAARPARDAHCAAPRGAGVINMSNQQTGRRIPFETGSVNMHTLLALQTNPLPAASDVLRQGFMLMFLSLPVFQAAI